MPYIGAALFIMLAAVNIFAFGLVWHDKSRSYRGLNRIPEVYFFVSAALWGSLGVYLAMLTLRHKIRKWYFAFGLPVLMIQNILSILFVIQKWHSLFLGY